MSGTVAAGAVSPREAVNARILAISEDRIEGFHRDPLGEIARRADLPVEVVIDRLQAMLRTGTVRRVRQTLLATSLAHGALVAWQVPEEQLQAAFDWMFQQDPFTGHVVIRSTDGNTPGARYRLWTTLKVPQGFALEEHCRFLCRTTGALDFRIMPARCLFTLGVGHIRRSALAPGSKAEQPARPINTHLVELEERDWQVLLALKREFTAEELGPDLWAARATEAGVPLAEFFSRAEALNQRGIIGRFSTFLEHHKPVAAGERVTRFNALFHWAVPTGRELEAGCQIGRFHILTHAYWREGGPEFGHVNLMAVAHGLDRDLLLAHKAAMDSHLTEVGIPVAYTNVFWGGRSEIKPSEIAPAAYREWCAQHGFAPHGA